MAKTVLYQHGDDNVAPNGTWSVETGTEDPDYPASCIADGLFTKPAKLSTTTGAWMVDFGSAQRVDLVALGVHNITAGATVKLQANATPVWTGPPTIDTTLTIAAADADGRVCHAWKDLTGVTGYSTGGFQYWRLAVTSGNTSILNVGEIWLGRLKRTFDRNYQWEYETSDLRRTVEHMTQYGVRTIYDLLVRQRQFVASVRASDVGLAAIREWHRSARGSVRPVLFLPDATVNDAWWVYLPSALAITSVFTNVHDVTVTMDELSPGIPL